MESAAAVPAFATNTLFAYELEKYLEKKPAPDNSIVRFLMHVIEVIDAVQLAVNIVACIVASKS